MFHFRRGVPVFDRMWEEIDTMIEEGTLVFVKESYNELERQLKDDESQDWLKARKKHFTAATNEECVLVAQLYATRNFQDNVAEKNLRNGQPVADPFIVAHAKALGNEAVVVSREVLKPNAAKIPNMCEELDVVYMDDREFQALLLR